MEIELHEVSRCYKQHKVVNSLTFTIKPGVVTGFLGPNGAGKSTTMRIICGIEKPSEGQVFIGGKPYSHYSEPSHIIGALLDPNGAYPNRNVYNHLKWIAAITGIATSRIDEVLNTVGLSSAAKIKAKNLSLDMRQRMGIAAALLGNPKILIFDEPVNGLGSESISWIRNLMKLLASQGRTIFVSSNVLSELALIADHLIVIGTGKLLADMNTKDFIKIYAGSALKVRSGDNISLAGYAQRQGLIPYNDVLNPGYIFFRDTKNEQIGNLAAKHNIPLYEIGQDTGNLEDAYFRLTASSTEYISKL